MSQCEKKCDCEFYDDMGMGDHRSALIKMELPVYDEQYGGNSYTICRGIRLIGYVVVLVLLSYSLWRIHVIESTLMARDRYANITKVIGMGSGNLLQRRIARSISNVNSLVDQNGFEMEKELARGGMLTSKNEAPMPPKKKLKNKEDFNFLVNSLFDKIQMMHNDTDRSHFDNNMKAVFQAWFPVFDALLPRELMEMTEEEAAARNTRSAEKSSEESSEEKKDKQDKPRQTRSLMSTSDESSSEEQAKAMENEKSKVKTSPKKEDKKDDGNKSSEESSEEKNKNRKKRSYSDESSESNSSDENKSNSIDISGLNFIMRGSNLKITRKSSETPVSSENDIYKYIHISTSP